MTYQTVGMAIYRAIEEVDATVSVPGISLFDCIKLEGMKHKLEQVLVSPLPKPPGYSTGGAFEDMDLDGI